jgi:hypothetical protein
MGKHYVPQNYLRAFASDAQQRMIWMFDKAAGTWVNAAIAKVAQSTDYFSPDVEQSLTFLVENPGNVALNALRRGETPTPSQGGDLLSYIAVMLTRVPRKRIHAREIIPGVLESVIATTRAEILAEQTPETESRVAELLRELDRVEEKYRMEAVSILQEQIEDPWPTEKILRGIHTMFWRIVEVPTSTPILTSDNPAFFFTGYGIGSPESEVTFPLSPHLVLMGCRQGSPGEVTRIRAKRPLAKEINRRMVVGATRFVFSSKQEGWVRIVSTRSQPDLNRIQW